MIIPRAWLAIGALVLVTATIGVIAEFRYMSERIGTLSSDLREAEDRAEANATALRTYVADREHNASVARDVANLRSEMRASVRAIQTEIHDAPPEDDGPIAPVMQRTLERLRALAAADANRDGEKRNPERTGELRAGDAAAADGATKPIGAVAHAGSGERLGVPAGRGAPKRRPLKL